ncbi:hypothetical protein BDF20DRAFT_838994 [Mycotypha africana]|uniref:uncharacterized protein n=1 Tax=Mycotypha africana TaxID=64632 RepID=UPI0023012995|nr:uncharacterized protein BDF20DRAFT_838994 [Mycotypha africana]KAI8969024.1 hypothetical protein BDF20DRAFT_838994 [Mycotypha africana]
MANKQVYQILIDEVAIAPLNSMPLSTPLVKATALILLCNMEQILAQLDSIQKRINHALWQQLQLSKYANKLKNSNIVTFVQRLHPLCLEDLSVVKCSRISLQQTIKTLTMLFSSLLFILSRKYNVPFLQLSISQCQRSLMNRWTDYFVLDPHNFMYLI